MLNFCWWSLHLRPLGHEVCEYLRLDRAARSIRDVLPHQLKGPFCDSSFSLGILDDFPEWVLGHHCDGVRVKVMTELAL
jgi:hypothetical protein